MSDTRLSARLERINRISLLVGFAVLTCAVLVTNFALGLSDLIDASRTQAKVLAANAAAPVAFVDAKAADEVLQSLRAVRELSVAEIFDKKGISFAIYRRADANRLTHLHSAGDGYHIHWNAIVVQEPMTFQHAVSG